MLVRLGVPVAAQRLVKTTFACDPSVGLTPSGKCHGDVAKQYVGPHRDGVGYVPTRVHVLPVQGARPLPEGMLVPVRVA